MKRNTHVVFQAEGGPSIGMGHIRRCLTLAGALRELGVHSTFLLNPDPMIRNEVDAAGFDVRTVHVNQDFRTTIQIIHDLSPKTVIVDSYNLSTAYFSELAQTIRTVVVLDDLGDRELPVSLIVNGSAGAEQLSYRAHPETKLLLGPQYILLGHEFRNGSSREISKSIERILITVGGADPYDLTLKFTGWVSKQLGSVEQHIVVGPLFTNTGEIKKVEREGSGKIHLHHNPQNMQKLMVDVDLAISGGGQTTYELAAVGVPAIAVRIAKNQTFNLEGLSKTGTLLWVGDAWSADLEHNISRSLTHLAADSKERSDMRQRGRSVIDGRGTLRVAQEILNL